MKIISIYNPEKISSQTIEDLKRRFKDCRIEHKFFTLKTLNRIADFKKYDLCLTFGGDGTILKVARHIVDYGIPILSIKCGERNFIAEFTIENFLSEFPKLLGKSLRYFISSSGYKIQKRKMLEVEFKKNKKIYNYVSLNDFVIRTTSMRAMNISVKVGNERFIDYLADGLIISSPTGSTAYSLSADGPVVLPEANVLILNPILPHLSFQKAIILPDDVFLTIDFSSDKTVMCSVDGQVNVILPKTSRVKIRRYKKELKFIVSKDYLSNFSEKLKYGK